MWPAQYRAARAVPPHSLEELRPAHGTVALRITLPGCTECARFEVEDRSDYEAWLKHGEGVTHIYDWDCQRASYRRSAEAAGVDELPSYVLLPAKGAPRVVRPHAT
tara:strand:+ start:522 stop:839 length:318 start_codon:yes stop_codon:yes gene_type:complete